MTINYDFNDAAEGGDFVTLDAGRYIFKLIKVISEKSKAGNPMATVTLQVTAATGANEIYEDGVVTQHWPTNGKAAFRFRDFLVALRVKSSNAGKINLKKYYGKEIGAVVSVRPSDDGEQTFNDLKGIVPGDQMRAILFPDDEEEDFDEDDDVEDVDDDVEEDVDDDDDGDGNDDDWGDDDDDEEGEEVTKDDLKEMSVDELKELAEDWEVSTRKPRGKTLTKGIMRKRLADYIDSLEEDEEDSDDDSDDDDDDEPF